MDTLFWILAGVVVGCVVGIVIIWRLEVRAERRAADTRRVEAEVSARLKIFDPRAVVEEVDTRPIPAASPPDVQQAPRTPVAPRPGLVDKTAPPAALPGSKTAGPEPAADAPAPPKTQPRPLPASGIEIRQSAPLPPAGVEPRQSLPLPPESIEQRQSSPLPPESIEQRQTDPPLPAPSAAQWAEPPNGKVGYPAAEDLPTTPEAARLRAVELGRERRYLEQAIDEQQARLAELLHNRTPGNTQEIAAIGLLRSELSAQRQRLEEIIVLEERCRQLVGPSLEQLARHYKNAATPRTPGAFGVRRHSLAPLDPPGQNPPVPPTQAKTDTSS